MRRALTVVLVLLAVLVTAAGVARSRSDGETSWLARGPQAAVPAPDDGDDDLRGLMPQLRNAFARAREAARAEGVVLRVNSGRRSRAEQQRLWEEALVEHGSASAAKRWVLPPDESAHVRGAAVDVGPPEAARWLELHGERWGLCRVYANEPWHFERLAGALGSTCPPLRADAATPSP